MSNTLWVFLGLAVLTGLAGAGAWLKSALIKPPSFEGIATFMADESGMAPADRYLKQIGKWNTIAAVLTALSVVTSLIFSILSSQHC